MSTWSCTGIAKALNSELACHRCNALLEKEGQMGNDIIIEQWFLLDPFVLFVCLFASGWLLMDAL